MKELDQQTLALNAQAGRRRLIVYGVAWPSGECAFIDSTKFPDMAAIRKRIELHEQIDLLRQHDMSIIPNLELEHPSPEVTC